MDIDITELTGYEIVRILTNYPRGRLAIKHDRIFWDSGSLDPVPSPQGAAGAPNPMQPQLPPHQQRRGNQLAGAFERMADTLGSMVC